MALIPSFIPPKCSDCYWGTTGGACTAACESLSKGCYNCSNSCKSRTSRTSKKTPLLKTNMSRFKKYAKCKSVKKSKKKSVKKLKKKSVRKNKL